MVDGWVETPGFDRNGCDNLGAGARQRVHIRIQLRSVEAAMPGIDVEELLDKDANQSKPESADAVDDSVGQRLGVDPAMTQAMAPQFERTLLGIGIDTDRGNGVRPMLVWHQRSSVHRSIVCPTGL